MQLRSLLVAVALQLAVVPWAGGAHAAPSDADRAVEVFRQAQDFYEKEDYEAALERFREVTKLIESPNAWLYIARCEAKLDRKPRAFEAMSEAVDLANRLARRDPSYLRTRDAAAAEREAIVPEISRVILAVADPPAGLEVTVNSRTIAPSEFGRQLGVEPGSVMVTAEAPGYKTFRQSLRLGPGGIETIPVTLNKEGGTGPGSIPEEESSDALFITGWVVAGLGVAGMAMFAVAGTMANERFDQVETECVQPPCVDPKYTDLIDEGKTMDLMANIGLGVGIGGIVIGTAMVIFGWPSDGKDDSDAAGEAGGSDEPDAEQAIVVDGSPSGFGLRYQLTF